jgi:hypothetical protein
VRSSPASASASPRPNPPTCKIPRQANHIRLNPCCRGTMAASSGRVTPLPATSVGQYHSTSPCRAYGSPVRGLSMGLASGECPPGAEVWVAPCAKSRVQRRELLPTRPHECWSRRIGTILRHTLCIAGNGPCGWLPCNWATESHDSRCKVASWGDLEVSRCSILLKEVAIPGASPELMLKEEGVGTGWWRPDGRGTASRPAVDRPTPERFGGRAALTLRPPARRRIDVDDTITTFGRRSQGRRLSNFQPEPNTTQLNTWSSHG